MKTDLFPANLCQLLMLLIRYKACKNLIQRSPFISLYIGFIGMDQIIRESCYEGTILQRNFGKIIEKLSFYGHFPIIPF